MALKTYDIRKHDITFAGILLNEGLADGTVLSITSEAPGFTTKVGADGEVTRTRNHNRVAVATLSLMQTSELNDRLSAVYKADRDATNGQGVGAFSVQDRAGTTKVDASKAFISNDPDLTLEAEASTRDWEITLTDYRPVHGGNPDE